MKSIDHKKLGFFVFTLLALSFFVGGTLWIFLPLFSRLFLEKPSETVGMAQSTQNAKTLHHGADLGQKGACAGIDEVWKHVYHGRFKTAQDRLKVIEPCKTVMGIIVKAKAEKDGDFHIQLAVDGTLSPPLVNEKNMSGQHGYLVVEPICENPVSQRDTLHEGVCSGFSQRVFTQDMIGKKAQVTGAYVLDVEHGWLEEHPISKIEIIQ